MPAQAWLEPYLTDSQDLVRGEMVAPGHRRSPCRDDVGDVSWS